MYRNSSTPPPPWTYNICAHVLCPRQKRSAKGSNYLKKTTGLCHSRSYYSHSSSNQMLNILHPQKWLGLSTTFCPIHSVLLVPLSETVGQNNQPLFCFTNQTQSELQHFNWFHIYEIVSNQNTLYTVHCTLYTAESESGSYSTVQRFNLNLLTFCSASLTLTINRIIQRGVRLNIFVKTKPL